MLQTSTLMRIYLTKLHSRNSCLRNQSRLKKFLNKLLKLAVRNQRKSKRRKRKEFHLITLEKILKFKEVVVQPWYHKES